MALTDVKMWRDGIGFCSITPKEAERDYPYSVSADSGVFICNKCQHYVLFITNSVYASHFKHNSGDEDKDCNERIRAFNQNRTIILKNSIAAPLRLQYSHSELSIEIGFPPLKQSYLESAEKEKSRIEIFFGADRLKSLLIDQVNFSTTQTIYHSIGNRIGPIYEIRGHSITGFFHLPTEWNEKIQGINGKGALFDGETRKKIPDYGDVTIGKEYLLLTKWFSGCMSVDLHYERLMQVHGYTLYIVSALRLSKDAYDFFHQYNANLTLHPTTLIPIWPPVKEADHVIETNANTIFFMQTGDAVSEAYPCSTAILMQMCCSSDSNAKLLRLSNVGHTQMVWAARMSVLRYWYIRPQTDCYVTQGITYKILDSKGESYESGIYKQIPPQQKLNIILDVDGQIRRYCDKNLVHLQEIHAGEMVYIDGIRFGQQLNVYVGNDRIIELDFQQEIKTRLADPLSSKLRKASGPWVELPNRYKWILRNLETGSFSYQYIYSALNSRSIRKDALAYINEWIGGNLNG